MSYYRDTIDRLSTHAVLVEVAQERFHQDDKWGEQNHDLFLWTTILTEEVGELAQAALQARYDGKPLARVREEAIQAAAVAVAIIECLDRKKWRWSQDPGVPGGPAGAVGQRDRVPEPGGHLRGQPQLPGGVDTKEHE